MNCPNCGAETNESVCPVCGAAVGTSGGFALAGNDQPQQPENAAYGAQPQQGMGMGSTVWWTTVSGRSNAEWLCGKCIWYTGI